MRLVEDYRHDYRAANGFDAYCRVRVFEPVPEDRELGPVVIISEPTSEYDGPSVTNNIEQIAAEVVVRFALPSTQTAFIEHYPEEAFHVPRERETFDLVTFGQEPNPELAGTWGSWMMSFGSPSWEHVEREDVEELIGRRLEE